MTMHFHATRAIEDDRTATGYRYIGQPSVGYNNPDTAQDDARNLVKDGAKCALYYECEDDDCQMILGTKPVPKQKKQPKAQKVKVPKTKTTKRQKVKGQRKARIPICAVDKCKTGMNGAITIDGITIVLCITHYNAYNDGRTLIVKFLQDGELVRAEISNED
jgi:hypothetical protein